MAEIVNLRAARKAKARKLAGERAEGNRQRFGRTKAEKAAAVRERERSEAMLDGARLEKAPDQG